MRQLTKQEKASITSSLEEKISPPSDKEIDRIYTETLAEGLPISLWWRS